MGRVLCTYFISYKTACNSPHKSTTVFFFLCYPTRYVTIRLHAIARRHDDKTERHFMQSINNIFFKIKFHTQKYFKNIYIKKRKVYQTEIIRWCRFTILFSPSSSIIKKNVLIDQFSYYAF